jgi:hypothetical protein
MKKIYLLLNVIAAFTASAQCPPGGLTITSQSQINNFITTYPDCTQINGDVIIDGINITSLAGFANITTITGALEIREVSSLVNLNGLQNLETVGTDLILREVEDLENIEALGSLTSVGGEFTVRSCPELTGLDGIENLTTVGLGLIIRDCGLLTSIEGLTGVTYVGEILEVVECPLLASLAGLENIETIIGGEEGALVIEGNAALTSLSGFGSADTEILGSITISTNGELSYCSVAAICNFLQNIPEGAMATFGLNVTGCNTEAEVTAECAPLPVPSITSFTPAACAGSEITITGTDFAGITSVIIGGNPVISYTVASSTEITAVAGPLSSGVIAVTNTSGTAVSNGTFTIITDFPAAPSGSTTQAINVHAAGEATLADIELTLLEGGTVTWYATEEDAELWRNPLHPDSALENGATYYATQTVGSCTSAGFFAVTVNMVLGKNDFKPEGLSYYPVPVNDILNISYSAEITHIAVINILGQQVIYKEPKALNTQIDMGSLPAGVYIVSIGSGKSTGTFKVVKE